MEAPDGQDVGASWTVRAISARTFRIRRSFTARVSSCVSRNLPRSVAKSPLKATNERFPLDHTRKPLGRRPDALPVLSGASMIRQA